MRRIDDRTKERLEEYARKSCRERPKRIEAERSQKGRYHTDVTLHFDKQKPVTISVHDMMLGHSADDTLGDGCEKSFYSGAIKNARSKGNKRRK